MLDIRQAAPEDLGAVENLLSICLLPHQDVRDAGAVFFIAESERGIIGVVGLEDRGDGNALLRSLAVMPGYRKQQIARQLLQRLLAHAATTAIVNLYLLTEMASDYFKQIGFAVTERQKVPDSIRSSRQFTEFCPRSAMLMSRRVQGRAGTPSADMSAAVIEVEMAARRHFDSGYYCAESVLLAVAERLGIESPLLPAIATGFCNGVARTWGTCGALNGGIMAVSLVYGRQQPGQSVADNHRAVRRLIDDFGKACGSTTCSELIACDLDTRDGRRVYTDNHLRAQCRQYVGTAARLAALLVEEKVSLAADRIAGQAA